ncbi:MAG: hypothetical protein HY717_04030 [Planctomycetes bacterium]|nr:hypothetical protein [Planctomycetota bacterium]
MFFTVYSPLRGLELWRSDGSPEGTVLVKDIYEGPDDSNPREFAMVRGILYFSARDAGHGAELWRSDGTAASTVLAADLKSGPESSYPAGLVELNGLLCFAAEGDAGRRELWALRPEITATLFIRGNVIARQAGEPPGIGDAIHILRHLFAGGAAPACLKSADADDSGVIDLADAIALLRYLFLAGAPPRGPFPRCGPDPTPDGLPCASYPACE